MQQQEAHARHGLPGSVTLRRTAYIELETDGPTASGGRGASRKELAASENNRDGTCVGVTCVGVTCVGAAGSALSPGATEAVAVVRASLLSVAAAAGKRANSGRAGAITFKIACGSQGRWRNSLVERFGFCSRRAGAGVGVAAGAVATAPATPLPGFPAAAAGAGDAGAAAGAVALSTSDALRSRSAKNRVFITHVADHLFIGGRETNHHGRFGHPLRLVRVPEQDRGKGADAARTDNLDGPDHELGQAWESSRHCALPLAEIFIRSVVFQTLV